MQLSQSFSAKNIVGKASLIFPLLLLIAFAMHLHSFNDFFTLHVNKSAYKSDALFEELIYRGGYAFIHAHALAYASVPFMLITLLHMGYSLFKKYPALSMIGVGIGVLGIIALAGFFGAWLSFSAISKVQPQHYEGAKATLYELTRMAGILKMLTQFTYLTFFGFMVLGIGFFFTPHTPKWSPICICLGCVLLIAFMGLPGWMFAGSLLILAGLIPICK